MLRVTLLVIAVGLTLSRPHEDGSRGLSGHEGSDPTEWSHPDPTVAEEQFVDPTDYSERPSIHPTAQHGSWQDQGKEPWKDLRWVLIDGDGTIIDSSDEGQPYLTTESILPVSRLPEVCPDFRDLQMYQFPRRTQPFVSADALHAVCPLAAILKHRAHKHQPQDGMPHEWVNNGEYDQQDRPWGPSKRNPDFRDLISRVLLGTRPGSEPLGMMGTIGEMTSLTETQGRLMHFAHNFGDGIQRKPWVSTEWFVTDESGPHRGPRPIPIVTEGTRPQGNNGYMMPFMMDDASPPMVRPGQTPTDATKDDETQALVQQMLDMMERAMEEKGVTLGGQDETEQDVEDRPMFVLVRKMMVMMQRLLAKDEEASLLGATPYSEDDDLTEEEITAEDEETTSENEETTSDDGETTAEEATAENGEDEDTTEAESDVTDGRATAEGSDVRPTEASRVTDIHPEMEQLRANTDTDHPTRENGADDHPMRGPHNQDPRPPMATFPRGFESQHNWTTTYRWHNARDT